MCSKDETLQNNLIWYRLEWTVVFCEMVLKMYFFNWTLILSWYVISMHFYVNKVLMTTELWLMCACDLWVIEWGVPAWYRAIGGQFCQFVDLLLQKYVSWTNSFINPWGWWFGFKSCPKYPLKFSSVNLYDSSVFSFKLLGN